MQNLWYKDVTLNAYIHLSINKPSHKSIIMCGRSFLISSDSYLVRTYEFTDETSQIAEKQLVMTMDKAQETRHQSYKSLVSLARPIPLQARGRVWGNACIEFVQAAIFLVNDVLKYHMIIINNYFIISKFHMNSRAILFYYFNIFPLHVIVIVRNRSLAI